MSEKNFNVKLTVPKDISFLPVMLAYVKELAKKIGFDEDSKLKIQLGVEEAITQLSGQAFARQQDETFEIACEETTLGMTVAIREAGVPVDQSWLSEAEIEKIEKDFLDKESALAMIRKFVDDISFQNMGLNNIEIHLTKYLSTKPVQDYLSTDDLEITTTTQKVTHKVRLMKPSEALEVSKCAYLSYGSMYTHENIYYPERVKQLNEAEKLISLVAVTKKNEVMGHIALIISDYDNKIATGGLAFVNPKYRGQGCLQSLLAGMFQEGPKRNLVGICGQATATHPYAQKGLHKFGMKDCAVLLSKLPPAEAKGGIKADSFQRRSLFYCFAYLEKPDGLTLYAPSEHRDMIEKIYTNSDITPKFLEPGNTDQALSGEDTRISIHFDGSGTANIDVISYGKDAVEVVSKTLKRLCAEKLETIYLYLRLADPLTAVVSSEFEKLGFFFSGIMPGSSGKDRMGLQYLNNQAFNYESLRAASKLGRELISYIRDRDPSL